MDSKQILAGDGAYMIVRRSTAVSKTNVILFLSCSLNARRKDFSLLNVVFRCVS